MGSPKSLFNDSLVDEVLISGVIVGVVSVLALVEYWFLVVTAVELLVTAVVLVLCDGIILYVFVVVVVVLVVDLAASAEEFGCMSASFLVSESLVVVVY